MTLMKLDLSTAKALTRTLIPDQSKSPEHLIAERDTALGMRPQVELICHGELPPNKNRLFLVCETEEDVKAASDYVKGKHGKILWELARIAGADRERMEVFKDDTPVQLSGYRFTLGITKPGKFTCSFCGNPSGTRTHFQISQTYHQEVLDLLEAYGIVATLLARSGAMIYRTLAIAVCDTHAPILQQLVDRTSPKGRLSSEVLEEIGLSRKAIVPSQAVDQTLGNEPSEND